MWVLIYAQTLGYNGKLRSWEDNIAELPCWPAAIWQGHQVYRQYHNQWSPAGRFKASPGLHQTRWCLLFSADCQVRSFVESCQCNGVSWHKPWISLLHFFEIDIPPCHTANVDQITQRDQTLHMLHKRKGIAYALCCCLRHRSSWPILSKQSQAFCSSSETSYLIEITILSFCRYLQFCRATHCSGDIHKQFARQGTQW